MGILKSKFLIKFLSLILSVLSVFSASSYKLKDVFDAVVNGWSLSYSAETRAEMISNLLLKNDNNAFEENTNKIAKDIIYHVIIQFANGNADKDAVTNALSKIPHSDIERSEKKTYDTILSADIIEEFASVLPESVRGITEMLAKGIKDLYVYFAETEIDGVYEFKGSYIDNYGEVYHVYSGAYYDTETGIIYGKNNDGIFGIGFDYDAKQYILQSPVNCWMRDFGYNIGFDVFGDLLYMNTNTARIKFSACGKNWMIQLWKGNYTILTNGAEIGMYYIENGKLFSYKCVEDDFMPVMEMSLLHGDDELFSRKATHWWLNGIQPGPAINRNELTLNGKITFINQEMSAAFSKALQNHKDISSSLADNSVEFCWI